MLGHLAAHTLCGAVGASQFWVCGLKVNELLQQLVEIVIRNRRVVQHIILVVVPVDFLDKPVNAFLRGGGVLFHQSEIWRQRYVFGLEFRIQFEIIG